MKTRVELKEMLKQQAEEMIDDLLDWYEATPTLSLTGLETELLELRQQLSQKAGQLLVNEQESKHPPQAPKCQKCQKPMQKKGEKEKTITTRLGALYLERDYYYCRGCQAGLFPLDQQLELHEKKWSPQLAQQMVWLSGSCTSFEVAAEALSRLGGIDVSDSTVWRRVEKWGEGFVQQEDEASQKAQEPLTEAEMKSKGRAITEKKGVALDGGFIYIRQEGWKELKVGAVFDVALEPTKNKETGKWEKKAHATNTDYVAHLGGSERIGNLLWAHARSSQWLEVGETIMLGDEAAWIWNVRQHHFASSYELVDWYHTSDRLHQAQVALFDDPKSQLAMNWYQTQADSLFRGHAADVATTLAKAATIATGRSSNLEEHATYFANNGQRMSYQTMQAAGFPIGSGVIESGCKQYKARFCGPGMRWSATGAKHLLPIRSAILSGSFDACWQRAYSSPPI